MMEKTMKRCALISGLFTLASYLLWRFEEKDIVLTIAITGGTIFYHITVRLLVGWAFDRLMHNQANYHKKWYQISPRENAIYKKLQIKRWKRHMPTYDESIFEPTLHTWTEIAKAMCQAELIHEVDVVVSFLPLFFSAWFGAFPVFLTTSVLAAMYDLLFVMLQRYNRPRVLRLAMRENSQLKRRDNIEKV